MQNIQLQVIFFICVSMNTILEKYPSRPVFHHEYEVGFLDVDQRDRIQTLKVD